MSTLVKPPLDRDAQRRQIIARIERDREQLLLTVEELRQPLQAIEHWQRRVREIWPVLPGLLVAGGIALVLLKTLVGRGRVHGSSGQPRRGGWLAFVLQVVSAYRVASQLSTLLRSSGTNPPGRPLPAPARAATSAIPKNKENMP